MHTALCKPSPAQPSPAPPAQPACSVHGVPEPAWAVVYDRIQQIYCTLRDRACSPDPGTLRLPPEAFCRRLTAARGLKTVTTSASISVAPSNGHQIAINFSQKYYPGARQKVSVTGNGEPVRNRDNRYYSLQRRSTCLRKHRHLFLLKQQGPQPPIPPRRGDEFISIRNDKLSTFEN